MPNTEVCSDGVVYADIRQDRRRKTFVDDQVGGVVLVLKKMTVEDQDTLVDLKTQVIRVTQPNSRYQPRDGLPEDTIVEKGKLALVVTDPKSTFETDVEKVKCLHLADTKVWDESGPASYEELSVGLASYEELSVEPASCEELSVKVHLESDTLTKGIGNCQEDGNFVVQEENKINVAYQNTIAYTGYQQTKTDERSELTDERSELTDERSELTDERSELTTLAKPSSQCIPEVDYHQKVTQLVDKQRYLMKSEDYFNYQDKQLILAAIANLPKSPTQNNMKVLGRIEEIIDNLLESQPDSEHIEEVDRIWLQNYRADVVNQRRVYSSKPLTFENPLSNKTPVQVSEEDRPPIRRLTHCVTRSEPMSDKLRKGNWEQARKHVNTVIKTKWRTKFGIRRTNEMDRKKKLHAAPNGSAQLNRARPVFFTPQKSIKLGLINYVVPEAIKDYLTQPLPKEREAIHFQRGGITEEILRSPRQYSFSEGKHYTAYYLSRGSYGTTQRCTLADAPNVTFVLKHIKEKKSFNKLEVTIPIGARHSFKASNIIKMYGFIDRQDGYYLLMEDGGASLRDFVVLENINDEFATNIFLEITRGIIYLHSNYVYHRDIKPANVAIRWEDGRRDGRLIVKLIDFGACITYGSKPNFRGMTPVYCAPEVCQCIVHVNPEKKRIMWDIVDGYALGAVLYYISSKKHIWAEIHQKGTQEIVKHIAEKSDEVKYDIHKYMYGSPHLKDIVLCLVEPDVKIRLSPTKLMRSVHVVKGVVRLYRPTVNQTSLLLGGGNLTRIERETVLPIVPALDKLFESPRENE